MRRRGFLLTIVAALGVALGWCLPVPSGFASGGRESVCIVTPGLPPLFECSGADDWCRDRHLQCLAEDIGSFRPTSPGRMTSDLIEEGWC